RYFAPAMENHRAHFVPVAEKANDLVLPNLVIMLRGVGPKLDFFELRAAAAFALLVSPFVQLVLIFPVIDDLANRRISRLRDFHEIEPAFARQLHNFKQLHDPELRALFVNYADLARPNALVGARSVGQPEIPFSDKSPSYPIGTCFPLA